MGFIDWFEKKFAGDLIAEYGVFSADAQGLEVSAALRQRRNGKHYLVFKWEGKSTYQTSDLEVTPEVVQKMAVMLKDVTTRLQGGAA